MRNNGSLIYLNNCSILNPKQTCFGCNCRVKDDCLLIGKWLTPEIIEHADVTNNSNKSKKSKNNTETTAEIKNITIIKIVLN